MLKNTKTDKTDRNPKRQCDFYLKNRQQDHYLENLCRTWSIAGKSSTVKLTFCLQTHFYLILKTLKKIECIFLNISKMVKNDQCSKFLGTTER